MEQLVNFIIRPPRADYNPKDDLLDKEFMLKGQWFQRKDLEVTNGRGVVLQCSHYMPVVIPEGAALPCVIYCHGNSGCRADASEAAIILLPSYITVFALDFSGSGLSGGEHVTLGWNEKDDLKAVVNYLRSDGNISCIGLWGRSMGAVTSLMYGAEDPSIAGMVLDSPFSDLVDLMNELVDTYKFRLPKFTVKFAIQYMRKVIQKKAKFDITDLNTIKVAKSCFVPVLIGHAIDDDFIQPHHSERIFEAYVGDKNIIKFEGDHNSPRPQFYFDSITIFFHNVLNPPKGAVEANYFDTVHDYYGRGSWDTFPEVGYTNHSFLEASKGPVTSSTEDAINELRSKRPMSRMEVPSDSPSKEKESGVKEGCEHDPVSSSGLISFEFPNGHSHVPLVTTTIDDDQYVEYPLDNLSDFPCNMEEEERMFMEAVIESLKDLEIRHPHEEQLSNMSANSPESSQKDDRASSSKDELCGSSKMDSSCIPGTNNTHDLSREPPSPDVSWSSSGHTSEAPPSFVKPGSIYERLSPDVSMLSMGTTSETPASFIKPESIGERSSPDVSVSSTACTSGTPSSFIELESSGTSAHSDALESVQNSSDGDKSIKEADMAGGTRATLTVQRNPTNNVLDGLMHRWGLNFFRNN